MPEFRTVLGVPFLAQPLGQRFRPFSVKEERVFAVQVVSHACTHDTNTSMFRFMCVCVHVDALRTFEFGRGQLRRSCPLYKRAMQAWVIKKASSFSEEVRLDLKVL